MHHYPLKASYASSVQMLTCIAAQNWSKTVLCSDNAVANGGARSSRSKGQFSKGTRFTCVACNVRQAKKLDEIHAEAHAELGMVPVINIAQLPKLPGLQQLVAKPAVEEEVQYPSLLTHLAGLVSTVFLAMASCPTCAPERVLTLLAGRPRRADLGLEASAHGQHPVWATGGAVPRAARRRRGLADGGQRRPGGSRVLGVPGRLRAGSGPRLAAGRGARGRGDG